MDLRKLKEKAAEAFARGKFARAAELYEVCCAGDSKDIQARLRMGDAFARAGAREKAIGAYKFAAEGFAREGFLPRAIAASKLILELDPTHRGVQHMLADLYAKRGASDARKRGTAPQASEPAAPAGSSFNEIELPAEDPPGPPEVPSRPKAVDLPDDDGGLALELEGGPPAPPEPRERSLDVAGSGELPVDQAPPAVAGMPLPELAEAEEIHEILADQVPETPVPPKPTVHVGATPASGAVAPPGLRLKRLTSEIPVQAAAEPAVDLTVRKPPPPPSPPPPSAPPAAPPATPRPQTPSRIWLPESFTPPPGATPPALPAAARRAGSDLEASFQILSRFDELDLDMAPGAPLEVAPPPQAPAPRAKPRGIPSFVELELEGDSLLHAVEMAAQAGISQRSEPAQPEAERTEESMSSVAEDFQGESKTPAGLPKIPLFSDLSADAFIELFDRCPLRRFGQSERIIEQGSVGDSFFVICAGAVRVTRQDEAGQEKELAVLQEGAFFGEVALLSGAPRTASVASHAEETQLLEISAAVLAQLSHRYPQVAAALKKFCRQRLLANLMVSSPLFKPFSRKDRKDLVERFRARDVQRNDLIIREGTPSDGLYVVLSGEVEVRKGKLHLATLREGEIFGEISLLQKQPATASVTASRRTSLLRLPREAFDQIILTHPQVLMLVSELSESRQRQTEAALSGELLV